MKVKKNYLTLENFYIFKGLDQKVREKDTWDI